MKLASHVLAYIFFKLCFSVFVAVLLHHVYPFSKGLSIKNVRSQGEKGLSSVDILRTKEIGGSLDVRTFW